jgi:hypothetical protein
MRPRKRFASLLALTLGMGLLSSATFAESVSFSSERWEFHAREARVVEHLGRESLYIKGGLAWLEDADFLNGTIEFDVAFTGERGFMGGIWRLQDGLNYEEFYLRPHQSGNPDANQYTPIFNGLPGWQLYHGDGHGAPVEYPTNEWIHVKIVVAGDRGEVYIDSEDPTLSIHELKREVKSGKIGVMAADFASAHFSGFRYRLAESPALKSEPGKPEPAPAGMVEAWSVSSPFAEGILEGKISLTEDDKKDLSWRPLPSERSGVANLARVTQIGRDANTVFARVSILAAEAQTKKIAFGYSDRVKVYLNGRLLYGGSNLYRSRDYRYLGTIGLFDELYLPLERGRNELWFAVSESFGGWGIICRFEDPSGIRLEG